MGLVEKARGKQRTNSTRILAVVRGLNPVWSWSGRPCATLSTVAPEWLQQHANPEWIERFTCEGSTTTGCPRARKNARPRLRR
jgi:hypothetical protein